MRITALEWYVVFCVGVRVAVDVAFVIRRLHAENDRLRALLRRILVPGDGYRGWLTLSVDDLTPDEATLIRSITEETDR